MPADAAVQLQYATPLISCISQSGQASRLFTGSLGTDRQSTASILRLLKKTMQQMLPQENILFSEFPAHARTVLASVPEVYELPRVISKWKYCEAVCCCHQLWSTTVWSSEPRDFAIVKSGDASKDEIRTETDYWSSDAQPEMAVYKSFTTFECCGGVSGVLEEVFTVLPYLFPFNLLFPLPLPSSFPFHRLHNLI